MSLVAGCAARRNAPSRAAARVDAPTTLSIAPTTLPTVATLSLDQIMPPAELPRAAAATAPSTAPTTGPTTSPSDDRPPIEALMLYAEAVDDLNTNRRMMAIQVLEKAVALDPRSFDLHYALGRAYARDGTANPKALAELERAAEINPDHLRLQTELGRIYLAAGDEEKGLWRLRLALKTTEYPTDEADAALAELLLGRALARKGYHAAAVEVYERLLARLQNPGPALRQNPEIAFLIARPELLKLQVAESYAQVGRFGPALEVFREAAKRDPGSFELRARVVRALVGLGRYDEAASEAADAVARFRASPASIALLREVSSADAKAGGLVDRLRQMLARRPRERSLMFALADVLSGEGRAAEARSLLAGAAKDAPADPELVRRLYEVERDSDATGDGAARFLVGWSAAHPGAVHLLGEQWDDLLRHVGARKFGLRRLRALEPPSDPDARWNAAKEFWVAHVARLRHRRDVARVALKRAADATPAFEPAPRAWAGWDRDELGVTPEGRTEVVERYATAAQTRGDRALAEELRGMMMLSSRDFAAAREHLSKAVELSPAPAPPERRFELAVAARGAGDERFFEQALWKIAGDWPGFEDAYDALYAYYEGKGDDGESAKVLSSWLGNDPGSVAARLVQVREQVRAGRLTAAQGLMQRLFVEKPGDARVLSALRAMYGQPGTRTLAWLLSELQQRHASSPGDVAMAAQLVDLLAGEGRAAEATRALDATRAAVADDADLLYQVAHLYGRLGQKDVTEQVLRDALELEPDHAPAANDLGYSLADAGRDLEHAEALTRMAVKAEPTNPSFLDSFGWVLYKRGAFAEARRNLRQAAGAQGDGEDAEGPDPVVLDHLGDTIYRLGDAAAAGAQWDLAQKRLADMPADQRDRDDLKQLRLQLERKKRQLDAGQPVSVAPVTGQAGAGGPGRVGRESARGRVGVE